VTLRDEETDERRRVTTVEERVERGDWTEIRSLRYVGWELARTLQLTERTLYSIRSFILSE